MSCYEDEFRLKTNSERFADLFYEKMQKAADNPKKVGIEKEYISKEKSGYSWYVEVFGEPFGGSSQDEAETMADMLMTCLSEESAVSIAARYDLFDIHDGDQATVRYTYPNENGNFQMTGFFYEYCDDDSHSDDESECFIIIEYAKQEAGWKKVKNKKAKELGTPVISEEEILRCLDDPKFDFVDPYT